MWSLRRPAIAALFVVELFATVIAVTLIGRVPVHEHDLVIFGILALASIVHMQAVRGIELTREGVSPTLPTSTSSRCGRSRACSCCRRHWPWAWS